MKVTCQQIKHLFIKYNGLYFNSELPLCEIRVSSMYRCYGEFRCKVHEKYKRITCKRITISDLFDYTEENLRDVLVHEMIHYYLVHKKRLFKDSFRHCPEFMQMINEFNEKFCMKMNVVQDRSYIKLLPTTSRFLFELLNIV